MSDVGDIGRSLAPPAPERYWLFVRFTWELWTKGLLSSPPRGLALMNCAARQAASVRLPLRRATAESVAGARSLSTTRQRSPPPPATCLRARAREPAQTE